MNAAFFLLLTAVGLLITRVKLGDWECRKGIHTPLGKLTALVMVQVLWAFIGMFVGIFLLGVSPNPAFAYMLIAAFIWGLTEKKYILTATATLLAVSAGLLLFTAEITSDPAGLHTWYAQHAGTSLSLERLVAILALLILLGSPANAVVSAVLERARREETATAPVAPADDVESRPAGLRGGRLIGVLERYLLVVLASAGLTAAIAALVAAKGVIRFPEISQDAKSDSRGAKAEEFLAGSLTSWSLASLAVLLLNSVG